MKVDHSPFAAKTPARIFKLLFKSEIADGRLIRLLPKWQLPEVSMYAMYPSRHGLPLAVRMLMDHLMASLDRWHSLHNLEFNDVKRRRSG